MMNMHLHDVYNAADVVAHAQAEDNHLVVSQRPKDGSTFLHVFRQAISNNDDASDTDSSSDSDTRHVQSSTSKAIPILTNHQVDSISVLNVASNLLFVALSGGLRVVVCAFDAAERGETGDATVVDLPFKESLFALRCVDVANHAVVFAVSKAGEVAFLHAVDDVKVQVRACDRLAVGNVASVAVFNGNHFVVFGVEGSNHVAQCVRFTLSTTTIFDFSAANVEISTTLQIPSPTSVNLPGTAAAQNAHILDACFFSHCAVMLWSDGTVIVLAPGDVSPAPRPGMLSLQSWFLSQEDGDLPYPVAAVQYFRLATKVGKGNPKRASVGSGISDGIGGGVMPVGKHYVAIAYGNCISIWDVLYFLSHDMLELKVACRSFGVGFEEGVTLVDEKGVKRVSFGEAVSRPPLLSASLRKQTPCDGIVTAMRAIGDQTPARTHILATSALHTAADAGGDLCDIFNRTLKRDGEREVRDVRKILTGEKLETAEALRTLCWDYFDGKSVTDAGKARMVGNVPRLPSDRLAAACVARCVYSLAVRGNAAFVVPLIDMVGTGVVSAAGVLTTLQNSATWREDGRGVSVDEGSFVALLLKAGDFCNVLEAVLDRIVDLPEADIVQILFFAARWRKQLRRKNEGKGKSGEPGKGDGLAERVESVRANGLLCKCIQMGLQKERLMVCLSEMPFARVMLILVELELLLCSTDLIVDEEAVTEVERRAKQVEETLGRGLEATVETAKDYRGIGRWLDAGPMDVTKKAMSVAEGCAEWICHIVDTHFSNIVLDKKASLVASRMLERVRRDRSQAEKILSLEGMVGHLCEGRLLPQKREDLFHVREIQVLRHAGF